MTVITALMNEESTEFANKKITLIPIDDIYPNPLNKAPITNINDLVVSIKESSLRTPLSVYKLENHHYILLNGERRYTALKELGQEDIPVIIEPKPASLLEERLIILDANAQRDETKEYKQQRACEYEALYLELKKQSKISPGMLKIDWIGMHMNISGRQVQRYLKKQQHGHDVHVKEVSVSSLSKKLNKIMKSYKNIELDDLGDEDIDVLKLDLNENIEILSNLLTRIK